MNIQTYAKTIAHKFHLTHQETERLIKSLLTQMTRDLAYGRRVYFRGFGSYRRIIRPRRTFRNMITGKIQTTRPKKDIAFTPSPKLLKRI